VQPSSAAAECVLSMNNKPHHLKKKIETSIMLPKITGGMQTLNFFVLLAFVYYYAESTTF